MSWEIVRLGDILNYEQPTNYIVESDSYDNSYPTPVLTAGKSFILGYTNESNGVYNNLPAIIFDDFTTVSKYVDFKFKVKSSAMKILTCDTKRANLRFLYYLLQTINFDSEQHKRYWISTYANFEIQLPPLETQKRIADILDAADALRQKDQELLKKYDELAQAIFIDMFGDPVKNEKGWDVKSISEIVQSEDHLRIPIESSIREGRKGAFAYYGASGIIDYVDDFIFEGKRLLIGEDGANLLARSTPIAFIADGKYWVNNHAHVLNSTNKALLSYLMFWFNSISLVPYITGSAQPKLNGSKLMNIKVPVPEHTIINNFEKIIENINITKGKELKSKSLFDSLLQKAFKGELVA